VLLFTDLLRFRLIGGGGPQKRIADLAISLLDEDRPRVTHILIGDGPDVKNVGWEKVKGLDTSTGTVDLGPSPSAISREDPRTVLLRRDILDALIIDLLGRQTTRVCDLVLEDDDGSLCLSGAAVGIGAMVRRILRGRWPKPTPKSIFDWKYVEFLRGDPRAVDNGAGYRMRIGRLPPGEIARLADYVPYIHAAELFKLLPDEKAVHVLEATSIERQVQIVDELDEAQVVSLLSRMSPDLATDLLGRLELRTMHRYIDLLPAKQKEFVLELLRYPEDSVGGAMTNDILVFAGDVKCRDAQEAAQKRLDAADFSSVIYIIDEDSRSLRGHVSLKELLSEKRQLTLEQRMDPFVQTLAPFDKARDAAYRIVSSQLPAMPVVDGGGRLLGAMTAEAAVARLIAFTQGLSRLKVLS
jgi:magnesium transporter